MDNKFETTNIVKIRLTASDIWLLGWIYLELCLHHLVFDLGFFLQRTNAITNMSI